MLNDSKFFYANALEAAVSPYDVSLKFSRNVTVSSDSDVATPAGTGTEAKVASAEELVVSMSPSHAKAMVPALVRLIQAYENRYGAIPLAPDMKAAWDDTFPSRGAQK